MLTTITSPFKLTAKTAITSAIKAPAKTWQNIAAAVQAAYKAEVANTTQINDIMDLAFKERDHATRVMLQWFIEEQGELVFEDGRGENPEEWVRMTSEFPKTFVRRYG